MATTIMSMAARSGDLEDQMSGTNLQTEGHVGMKSQHWKGPERTEHQAIPPPTCHLGCQPEGCCPTVLILGTA